MLSQKSFWGKIAAAAHHLGVRISQRLVLWAAEKSTRLLDDRDLTAGAEEHVGEFGGDVPPAEHCQVPRRGIHPHHGVGRLVP